MAASMAFRVAQLQGLAHTEAAPCSPPSLLYESPSNHKVSADSSTEADRPVENIPGTTQQTEDAPSEASASSAKANADSTMEVSSSAPDHIAIPGAPVPARKISGQRVARSNSTSKVAIRRRAAYSMPSGTEAAKQGFTHACPASDADGGEKVGRQRFLNIFEDETSAETGSAVDAISPVRRAHPRALIRDVNAVAAPANEESAAGSKDRFIPRRSAYRRGSYDSARLRTRYCRPEPRNSEFNGESSSEYSTDAASVNPSRNVKKSSEYSSRSVIPLYCASKNHVESGEETREQHRLASSPRCEFLASSRKKERHLYRGEAIFPHRLCTREKPSVSAPTLPAAATENSCTTDASTPAAAASTSAAASPAVASAAAATPADSSVASVSSHYGREYLSDDTDDCETEELVDWKSWRELLLERQRAIERHMHAQRRHTNRREKEQLRAANKGRRGGQHAKRSRGMHTEVTGVHTESDTDDEVTSKEEDPLGITPKLTTTKRSRSPEKPAAAAAPTRGPASPRQHFTATAPSAVASANSPATARSSAPPHPAGPPFFGSSFPAPAFYPSWPPSFYAAAVAAAAAARRAGEEAGMTGQERIQDLRKALERAESEIKDKEEEARNQLQEEKKKHEDEREELKKQLTQLRETLEEREKELTVATAKQAEAEKQKKVLREEFDIITRVHKDMKGEFQREKETLLAEKAGLQAKVEELEKSIEFSKDQLLVARESLVAARTKQLTATQAHEQDLKTLQEYRLEIETLREDMKYLQILNLSLTEKLQRFSTSPQPVPLARAPGAAPAAEAAAAAAGGGGCRRSGLIAAGGVAAGFPQQQQRSFRQCAKRGSNSSSNSSSSTHKLLTHARPTLQELLSPQLQQKLLRDRQNECRGSAACASPLKEATFTLPSSLESHGDPPAACSPVVAAGCNGGAGGGQRGEGGGGVNGFSRAAAYAAPAAAGRAAAAEAAGGAGGGEPPEEKGHIVEYCEQHEISRPPRHYLSFPFEKGGESSVATAACLLDSARARLRTASPASPSFRKDTNAAAGSPLRSVVAATAPRCRSVPSPPAFSAVPSRGRDTHTSHITTGLDNKEEMRLARLCATVLAAQSEREQKRLPRTAAAAAEIPAAPAAATSSSFRGIPVSLSPSSPIPRATLLQPHPSDPAAAGEQQQLQHHRQQPRQQQQQQQSHESPSCAAPHTHATVPPGAERPAADPSFTPPSFACRKREDYDVWSQSSDRRSAGRADQKRVSNASIFTRERSAVSSASTRQEQRLVSDASCMYMDKHRIPPSIYANEAEQPLSCTGEERLISGPALVNVAETYVSRCSYLQGEGAPATDSYTLEEKFPTCRSHGNKEMPLAFDSSFAQGENHCLADFSYPEKHPVSSGTYMSGQQRLLSNGSSVAGGSPLLPAFNGREEIAAAFASAIGGAAAAGRGGAPCCSHHTEETRNPTGYHPQIPCSSSTSHALNIGGRLEADNAEENKVKGGSSNCSEKDLQAEKGKALGQGIGNCRTEDNVNRSHCSAKEHAVCSVSTHSKDGYTHGSSKEGTACSTGIDRHEETRTRRVSVPGLALKHVSPSISCATADASKIACGNGSLCSGPNSARTQWLLNRVARISRLQGLQNIQEKLKDLPPALLAASDSARRSSQKRETDKAADSNNSSSIKSNGNSRRRSNNDPDNTNSNTSCNISSTLESASGIQQ